MSLQWLLARIWWFWLFLMIGLGAAFYYIFDSGVKLPVTQLALDRQQTLARAQASNITSFFQVFGDALAVMARSNGMERQDAITVGNMDVFIAQWEDGGLVGGIVFTDRLGVVEFNSNISGSRDLGMSLADRDYFVWGKGQLGEGEYFIGQPVVSRLGASEGQMIVPVASPVFRDGDFLGVVGASVKLQPLTKRFLELLKVSDPTDVYLVNKGGELLYSNSAPEAVDVNIFELFPELKNELNTNKEGHLEANDHLLSYAPVSLGDQNWLLIMVSSVDDSVSLTTPIYIRRTAILLLVFFTILLSGIMIIRERSQAHL